MFKATIKGKVKKKKVEKYDILPSSSHLDDKYIFMLTSCRHNTTQMKMMNETKLKQLKVKNKHNFHSG